MIVYKYDTQTKELIQELEINEAYGINLPFTTTDKPLAKKDGFAIYFSGTKWEYVEDFRNIVVYNKETKQESKISYLGKIKEDVTTLKPEQFVKWDYETNKWIEDIKLKKEYEYNQWKAERQSKVDNIEVELNGVIYQGDETSQTRIARAVSVMEDTDTTMWVAKDNSVNELPKADLKYILKEAGIKQTLIWNDGRPEGGE